MTNLPDKIESIADKNDFWGVVSIRRGKANIFSKAFGYKDVKSKLSNSIDTRFGIASGTKLFTALGIGRLIDQGKLSLTTSVSQIDKDFNTFIDSKATILQLLTHTSGIYDYYDEEIITDFEDFSVEIPWAKLATPSDYLPLFKGKSMKYKPGERYSYSNGGFVFLGIIIERVSGMPYRDFMAKNVLSTARMNHSGFYAFNNLPEDTANGYLEDRKTTNIYQLPVRGGGDGGMFTTASELDLLWEQLFADQILSPELTSSYLSTHCKVDDTTGYGCGIYKKLDDSAFFIVGRDAGVGFFSQYRLSKDIVISVISNVTGGEEEMVRYILEIIPSQI